MLFRSVAAEAKRGSRLRHASVLAGIALLVPWNFWRREEVTDLWVTLYEFVTRNAIGFAALAVVIAASIDAFWPRPDAEDASHESLHAWSN